ncbi:MAG TPA: vitamin K epoxide reductase family protein [Lapillicoccus sp.]|nr:vitamin K epoxide reductase family protein [Lapillicoccus sp.]
MTSPAATRRPQRTIPRWLAPLALTWCVLGLAVAVYLTYEHYTGSTTLACPATGAVDCAKVTSSAWSTILGIPVAPLGLVFFAVMLVLCLPGMLRRTSTALDVVRLGFCGIGLLMALYLLWAELFQIHAICLWCTGVHILTFLLFVTLLFGLVLSEPES